MRQKEVQLKAQHERPKVDSHFLIVAAEVNFVDRMYPTEQACFSEIWRRIRQNKRCQFCGSARLKVRFGKRTGNCGKCGKKFWLTAGTIFERMRSARPYLVAIHLLEKGIPFSARTLSRVCNIAYETASQIFKKIMNAVSVAMSGTAILVSSFEFNSLICKRSLETDARRHPVTEQEDAREVQRQDASSIEKIIEERTGGFNQPAPGPVCEEKSSQIDAAEQVAPSTPELIYELLSKEPQSMDQLIAASGLEPGVVVATVSILELADIATRLSGNRVVLSAELSSASLPQLDSQVRGSINQAIWFIRKFFHGVSRKYVQIYLAAYWCFIDRARWSEGKVFKQCCQTARVEMKTFVSPLELRFCTA